MTQRFSDEQLSAFIDRALAADEMAMIEQASKADPALARQIAALREVDAAIRQTYGAIDHQPVPDKLTRMLRRPAPQPRRRLGFAWNIGWMLPAAAAWALVIGIGIGLRLSPSPTEGLIAGVIASHNPLYQVLEQGASGQDQALPGGHARPILTLKTQNGGYCREFTTGDATRAIACREPQGWRVIAALDTGASDDAGLYAPAAGALPDWFDQVAATLTTEPPLDPKAEAEAIAQGWR